jgi:hypothetical protein
MNRAKLAAAVVGMAVGFWLTASAAPAPPAGPPAGLVLHYRFDQADTTGRVVDSSDRKNDGRASGVRWSPAGKQGGGCLLAPRDSAIQVPASDSLDLKQATIAAWFRTAPAPIAGQVILEGQPGPGHTLMLGIGGGASGPQARGRLALLADGKPCLSDNVVADGSWHHGAVTLDGDTIRLYVDGVLQKQSLSRPADLPALAGALTIGMNPSSKANRENLQTFEGTIDEVMIFNRPVPASELRAMVLAVDPAAGKPQFTKAQVAGRLRQLKLLFEEGYLTEEFYARKVAECEAVR